MSVLGIYYFMALIFIWNEVYFFKNYDRLMSKVNSENFETFTKTDVVYYLTKLFYWMWLMTGMMRTPLEWTFFLIVFISVLKIPAFFMKFKYLLIIR